MADHKCWLVVAVADDGDPELLRDAVLDDCPELAAGQREGDAVVFQGTCHYLRPLRPALEDVADHVDHLVFVASLEGGGGATHSEYHANPTDLRHPDDEIRNEQSRWETFSHFDYYASRYGVDGAI
ncbi:hypothetical protein [Halorubellus sp. PRR65]|uniref:hypothetical protein n=1 Tax=Halorubellus sp. PRR65 TaxID=3098148 RepID=UPI002B25E491|nr:hypothetical protein [Halorubellus sp. PRR65]